jgi:hypothetical protein|tara:strand:- start:4005 stop:4538 length:534 start_codon:yes stop_codon:yes gene_type:complete
MGSDLMDWCTDNQNICIFILLVVVLQCTGYLSRILNMCGLEGFEAGILSGDGIAASEPLGQNEGQQAVSGLGRTPSTCYPQQKLKPEDLLPTDENKAIQEFNIAKPVGEGTLQGVNMLDAAYHVGVNTVGQALRNGNLQLRSEPANPQVNVSPWMNSTIGPDLERKPLEVGEGCGTA